MINLINKFICFVQRHKLLVMTTCCLAVLLYADFAFSATEDCSKKSDSEKYLCYCKSSVIDKKYTEAGCWSCDVVFTLMMSMSDVAGTLFDATFSLSKIILGGGACIWIAVYFLKTLGSFTTQDPAKVIDGLLLFCFKVALMYALINSGIEAIVHYIVNPLLGFGFDIGGAFAYATGLGGW